MQCSASILAFLAIALASCALAVPHSDQRSVDLPNVVRVDRIADPTCSRGIAQHDVCCALSCGTCGGAGCHLRPGGSWSCCMGTIRRWGRNCNFVGYPCSNPDGFGTTSPPTTTTMAPTTTMATTTTTTMPPTTTMATTTTTTMPPTTTTTMPPTTTTTTMPPTTTMATTTTTTMPPTTTTTTTMPPTTTTTTMPPTTTMATTTTTMPPTTTMATTTTMPPSTNPVWQTVSISQGQLTPRHEACFVWSNGKGYLLGGRGVKPVDIFDPVSRSWTQGANPGIQIHHMQCVAYNNKIYIVSAWTRGFPTETNVDKIYIYDIASNSWSTKPGLPEPRRRGGSASVLYDDKIYVVAGNRGGHGEHATTLGWMDYYDLQTESWVTNLPDMPEPRDHVGGSVVNGNKLCIAGGRDGGVSSFFTATIASTYCYSFASGTWQNMNAPIPAQRAGASYGTTCAGHMMIAGGERTDAFAQVDVFDGSSWTTVASMQQKRHGSGLGVSACSCGHIFIASGSGRKGGSPELSSTEVFLPTGNAAPCASY